MSKEIISALEAFSLELNVALNLPHQKDFTQSIGAAIHGLGAVGVIDGDLGLGVCNRLRKGLGPDFRA